MSADLLVVGGLGLVWPAALALALRRYSTWAPAKLYVLLYTMHIGVPALVFASGFAPAFTNAANQKYIVHAIVFSWLCMLGVTGGAMLGSRLRVCDEQIGAADFGMAWGRKRLAIVVLMLLAVGWATRAGVVVSESYLQFQRTVQGDLEGPFYALIRMMEIFPGYAAIFAVVYFADAKRRGRPVSPGEVKFCVWLVISDFCYWLPTGRKEDTILSVLLPLATLNMLSGYVPSKKSMAAIAIFIAVLFPATHYYRLAIESNITELGEVDGSSLLSLAEATATSANDSLAPGAVLFNRISMLEPIAACVRLIDGNVWEPKLGESYAMFLLTLLPRFVWPGKPYFDYGQEFGRAAGFNGVDDFATSISVSYYGEGYLNFGWAGFIPMIFIGCCFAMVFRCARRAKDRATWTVLYVICLPSVLYFGNTFASNFGGLAKLLPVFFVVCAWMRRREGH